MAIPPSLRARYDAELRATAWRGAQVLACCAIALVPLFAWLDTVVFPEHEPLFMIGRVVCMLVAGVVLALLRTPYGRRHPLLLGVILPVTIGLDVDAMTMAAGRETSPYYAGVMVVLLAASLVLPWPPIWALAVSALLVGAYAIGTVVTGPLANAPLFMTNVFLLFATTVLVVVGAAVSERLRWREFESRMRLDAHARRQEAIAALRQLALSGVGSGGLMERAVEVIVATLGVDLAALLEIQPNETTLRLRAGVGWLPERVGRATVDAGARSQAAWALRARGPGVVEDLREDRRFTPAPLLLEHGIVSGVSAAIAGRDRPFGILGAYTTAARAFTPKEIAFVEAVGAVLANAISREQTEAALADEMHTSQALARVGRELISSLETPVLIERLCQLTAEVLRADYSNTWLWQPEEQVYVLGAAHGWAPEHVETFQHMRLPVAMVTPLLTRLEREEVVQLTPATAEPPFVADLMKRHEATLAIYIAFRKGEDVIGVQSVGYRGRTERLTAQEDRLARGIAQLAWMAFTNARLVEELERASRLKSEFVSTMSHELRTPLNVIVGYTDMLGEDLAVDERATVLARVRRSSLELLEMVEATLTLNRIAAGKDAPSFELVDVEGLWEELELEYAALPRAGTAALRFEPVASTALCTDRRKLKIVLKNLIGNALKFTPEGEIVVGCRSDGDVCTFTIRDTGIGIPPEQLPLIFEMFRQVDSSDVRSYGGAGLGLYIVRRLLSQVGGDVDVASEPGRGSTFTVTLPLRIEATAALGATS